MSLDALLWICTLLFAATMLILSAMRHAEAVAAADAEPDDSATPMAGRSAPGSVDLGYGWTLGGDGGSGRD